MNWHRNELSVLNIFSATRLLHDNTLCVCVCPTSARNTIPEQLAMSERREIINSRTQIYQFDNNKILSSHRLGAGQPAATEMYGSPFNERKINDTRKITYAT